MAVRWSSARCNSPTGDRRNGDPGWGGAYPGTYKVGFWYNSESFDDQQFDNQGVSLASPLSNGVPATHHGNYSVYGVVDQAIWHPPSNELRPSTSSHGRWELHLLIAT